MKIKGMRKIKKRSKILVKAKLIAQQVLNNFDEYQTLSIEDLKIRTDYLIDGLSKDKFTLDDILVDAFSIAREIIYREHKMLAFEVQIMGAYVVHCGDFAEMYTGEGKTLTLLIVSFLNALSKRGVHIVTVNEYLVERDAKFAQQAFEKLGITVGYNTSKLNKKVKKEMFARDITYTTNSELGFDYLKDNMARSIEEKVIRELFFVIVDEADSVLIDEARTPLIISGQPKEDFSLYLEIDKFVSGLSSDDYVIDAESNTISLSDSGVQKAEAFFKLENLFSVESAEIVHKITNALVAHYIFANGREYLVKSDKIYLVDQFTGRILEGRSYNAGLQQAIQAKERVKIEPENVIMATITYQSFFRLYKKLSGVSGTAMTEAEEFLKIYNMVVVRIPTNKPVIRVDRQDYIFGTKKVKWDHVIAEIIKRHETGQPILVGTASVTDSEIIHERLSELGISHEVLNARDNTKEAEIVKHAGEKGSITISTNMAGRGTDIKVNDEVVSLGGLYVIGTERHESRRIDNQLRGRTGRQGDPGESRFFTSLEDSLFKRFATDRFEKASKKLEDDFYDSKFFSSMLDRTQKKVEGLNFDIRKNLMDYDHVLSLQRELIYKQRDQILLKTSNFTIINNMIDDFVGFQIENFKNTENTSLIDAVKLVTFLNEKILKFDYFDYTLFANMPILLAADKTVSIIKKVVEIKYNILSQINGLNVIDEILIVNLDQKWTRHIDKMTKLREGVNLRSLEQRSPLNIYIEDGNNLFERMKNDIVNDTITSLCNLTLPNEINELTSSLDAFINSDDFKKKDFENQKAIEQNFNLVSTNLNEFDNFIIADDERNNQLQFNKDDSDFYFGKPEPIEEPLMEFDPYGVAIPQVNESKSDKYELKYGSSDANVLKNKSDLIEKSLQEIANLNSEIDSEQTEHLQTSDSFAIEQEQLQNDIENINFPFSNAEEVNQENDADSLSTNKENENIIPDLFPSNTENEQKEKSFNQSIQPQIPILESLDTKVMLNQNQASLNNEPVTKSDEEFSLSNQEIEDILKLPAFKKGEKQLTLGEYLDDVLDEMGLIDAEENDKETLSDSPQHQEVKDWISDIKDEGQEADELNTSDTNFSVTQDDNQKINIEDNKDELITEEFIDVPEDNHENQFLDFEDEADELNASDTNFSAIQDDNQKINIEDNKDELITEEFIDVPEDNHENQFLDFEDEADKLSANDSNFSVTQNDNQKIDIKDELITEEFIDVPEDNHENEFLDFEEKVDDWTNDIKDKIQEVDELSTSDTNFSATQYDNQKINIEDNKDELITEEFVDEPGENQENQFLDFEEKEAVKKRIIFDLSNDSDFQKYRNSVFVHKKNPIDYNHYKSIDNEDEEYDKTEIKPFYKFPMVQKRRPGTLFGGNIANKEPYILRDKEIFENLEKTSLPKFAEKNSVSKEEMNDLLMLDDEQERLEKISLKNQKIDEEILFEKELEDQINRESPLSFEDKLSQNFSHFNHNKNGVTEKSLVNNQPMLQAEFTDDFVNKQSYDMLLNNLKDINLENPDVIQTVMRDQFKQLSDVDLINRPEEQEENNFLKKFKFIKNKEKDYENETVHEIKPNGKESIHLFQKDVVDYLEKMNDGHDSKK